MAVTNYRTISNEGFIYVNAHARLPSDAVAHSFFITPSDGYSYRVAGVQTSWDTADSTATTATIMLKRCQGTEAPSAGDDLLSAALDTSTAAYTPVTSSLTGTTANLSLSAGDRLAWDVANGATELAGVTMVVKLARN